MNFVTELHSFKQSLLVGILFVLFASPFMFDLTQQFIGNTFKLELARNGVPLPLGLLVHGLLFALVYKLTID